MDKAADLLHQAEILARSTPTWADFANALYDPFDGILARAYPSREARHQFIQTEEYKRIQALLLESMERHGLIEGANPQQPTQFMTWFRTPSPLADTGETP